MMRFAGRMLPGSGAGPFTGQSESSGLAMSPNAGWRRPDFGPMIALGRGRVLSRVAALSDLGRRPIGDVSITVARRADVRESTVSAEAREATERTPAGPGIEASGFP